MWIRGSFGAFSPADAVDARIIGLNTLDPFSVYGYDFEKVIAAVSRIFFPNDVEARGYDKKRNIAGDACHRQNVALKGKTFWLTDCM